MRNFLIACFLSLIILTIIYKSNHDPEGTSRLISDIYSTALDTLRIDTSEYVLETYLQSAKTTTNNSENDLVALIYLVNTANLQIFTNMSLVNLYIIRENYIWTSNPGSAHSNASRFSLARVSTDGPGIIAGIFVDVVAEIKIDSVNYSVIARHQAFEGLK
ncbi:MAG TPA: hypothetical protein VK155_10575 [Bacteroidales bacterium]|jgi:hypothetical protein|nr:hypothetical protein [Bacteroidales bacterium]